MTQDAAQNPGSQPATPAAGTTREQKRALMLSYLKGKAMPALPKVPPRRPSSAPARPAAPAPDDGELLRQLARDTQALEPMMQQLLGRDPSLKARYFAVKQAVFDRQLDAARRLYASFKDELEDLERSVGLVQQSQQRAQAQYVADVADSFAAREGTGDGAANPFVNLMAGSATFSGMTSPKVQAFMAQHGLSEAEALAIRVFTDEDYRYMNPAVANQKDRSDRGDWMAAKFKPALPDLDTPYAFSDLFSAAKVQEVRAAMKPKGNALSRMVSREKTPASFEHLLDVVEQLSAGSLKMSAADFLTLVVAEQGKLSSRNVNELAGAEKERASFLNALGAEATFQWESHEIKQKEARDSPAEKAKAQQKMQVAQQERDNYDQGGLADKGSQASLSTEGAAHMAIALQGLRKIKPQKEVLFRGINLSPADFKKQYVDAPSIVYEALASHTVNRRVAADMSVKDMPTGNIAILMEIETDFALDISSVSSNPKEEERVLLPGAELKVISISEGQTGDKVVKLKQVR
jgi:NAD:arginine ADP-ribosyltransferase